MKNLKEKLESRGYVPREGDVLFLLSLLALPGVIRAGRITGPPGVGKTFLAEVFASVWEAKLVYLLLHKDTSFEDLFQTVNPAVVAALAGGVLKEKIEEASPLGAVAQAVILSQQQRVVLLLDEIDKAREHVDALLLDFLQSGRVQLPLGYGGQKEFYARRENLVVIVTDNQVRELSEPLLRRLAVRYEMDYLPRQVEAGIIQKKAMCGGNLAKGIARLLSEIRRLGFSSPSLQEGTNLAAVLVAGRREGFIRNAADVEFYIRSMLFKSEDEIEAFNSRSRQTETGETRPDKTVTDWAGILWGGLKQ
ncbi:MAG: MoxR family ATPase [Candidatus Aenigmatarchaeota archaeon]